LGPSPKHKCLGENPLGKGAKESLISLASLENFGGERVEERTILATTKMTSANQTTVPKDVRCLLGLRPGDRIVWVLEGREGRIYVEKG